MLRRTAGAFGARVATAVLAAALVAAGGPLGAQPERHTPYKLGTFAHEGRTFLGLVLADSVVVDLSKADASMPSRMNALLEQYDALRPKLAAIAAGAAASRPAHAYDVKALVTRPPVMPRTILNAAVNYVEHGQEMQGRGVDVAPASPSVPPIPGIWERTPGDARHNPYVFMKPVGAVIGNGDAIRLPPRRDRVDWECELSIVVGKRASGVPVARAMDHIAGYTLQNDVSDRGGRADNRHGSDWFIGKGHDTFAPLGPYIVPKEFVPDPQNLRITFTLSGKVMQDSNTSRMTHDVREMLSYVSHVLTLEPGDIIATGSPAGVGAARDVFMRPGDLSVCSIERIGTLTNPVMAAADASTAPQGRD
jgi:2-keto-4-pentenoate hydratase/2-oxohepta-3-ene-1,7-dioic acid hydratase in catechol pathway